MEDSELIACSDYILEYAEKLWNTEHRHYLPAMKTRLHLKHLQTFVLCARRMYNNGELGSFLAQIQSMMDEEAHIDPYSEDEEAHSDPYSEDEESHSDPNSEDQECKDPSDAESERVVIRRIQKFIKSSAEEFEKWYVMMMNCTTSYCVLEVEFVLKIITCILDLISDKYYVGSLETRYLEEHLGSLKSLILFVARGGLEQGGDLLAFADRISLNAAQVLFHQNHHHSLDHTNSEILALVEMMKSAGQIYAQALTSSRPLLECDGGFMVVMMNCIRPILSFFRFSHFKPTNAQAGQIYTQALTSSRPLLECDGGFMVVTINFLDSLILSVLEMNCNFPMDQLQELYEGLGSLRASLMQQPNANSDMELVQKFADVVCDIGISIYSVMQAQSDDSPGLPGLLQVIRNALADIGESRDHPQPPKLNSRTSSYGLVDYILEKLMELTNQGDEASCKLVAVQEQLFNIRSLLGKHDERVEIQALWDRLLEVALKAETVIDHLLVPDSFAPSVDSILLDIAFLMADVSKIDQVKQVQNRIHRSMPLQTARSDDVIGFHSETRSILDRLQTGSKHLQVIAVVGMPGQGKTTLATKVYNDESISCYFSARAWCPISQVFDKKRILLDLLKQIDPNTSSEMTENDLANKLRQSLKGRRYIIFLDDIWNMEAWNSLRDSFPDDSKGSRIILTSRSHEMPDQQPLILTQLNTEESLELLQKKLFPGIGNGWPPALLDLGMQMVEKCKGLPLAIIVLAGITANIEPSGWKEILDSFSLVSAAEYCRYTLELSYRHLPYYLRPCVLYVSSFSEDEEISVKRLARLWIAEGFVRKSESKSQQDVAEDYLKSLIGRSLIIVGKQKYDGGIKTCRIHDLLRDFFTAKAKDEHFFHFVKGLDELLSFNEPRGLRRLCIDGEGKNLKKLFCRNARSLLLISSYQKGDFSRMLHRSFKLLKVLDLERISVHNVFPVEIEHLLLLAFLAITGTNVIIPTWIANLLKLESFILMCDTFVLPDSLWKMQKLQYLHILGDGDLPSTEHLDSSCVLHELEVLTGDASIDWCTMEKQLSKFPCIRKLKYCVNMHPSETKTEYPVKFVFPDFLSKLESLHMTAYDSETRNSFEFTSLTSLKKLVLSDFDMYWEILSIIGDQLPNLEVLKLEYLYFEHQEKPTWEMKKGEFSKLRILHLSGVPLHVWRCSDDHEFECFQKLVLLGCRVLEELPSCLESIETLERIELYNCAESVQILARNIQQEQKNWGNAIVLKIFEY